MACAVVLTGLLSAWVATGGTGNIAPLRIQLSQAAIPMRAYPGATVPPSGPAGMFLTIWKLPKPAPPTSCSRCAARPRGTSCWRRSSGPEDPGSVVAGLTIPAKSSVTLTPFGNDVVLEDRCASSQTAASG